MPGRSPRSRLGDRAERLVAERLAASGWRIIGANVVVGRDEIDLIALEPTDPPTLVFVEVRSHRDGRFGAPEESVDRRKLGRVYRAAFALVRAGRLPDGSALPRGPWRVDVIAVDVRPNLARDVGGPEVRHLRGVTPE